GEHDLREALALGGAGEAQDERLALLRLDGRGAVALGAGDDVDAAPLERGRILGGGGASRVGLGLGGLAARGGEGDDGGGGERGAEDRGAHLDPAMWRAPRGASSWVAPGNWPIRREGVTGADGPAPLDCGPRGRRLLVARVRAAL